MRKIGSPRTIISRNSCGRMPVASALARASLLILLAAPGGRPAPALAPPIFFGCVGEFMI